jgi:hypothetical protein
MMNNYCQFGRVVMLSEVVYANVGGSMLAVNIFFSLIHLFFYTLTNLFLLFHRLYFACNKQQMPTPTLLHHNSAWHTPSLMGRGRREAWEQWGDGGEQSGTPPTVGMDSRRPPLGMHPTPYPAMSPLTQPHLLHHHDPPHTPQPCEYLLAGWIMGGIWRGGKRGQQQGRLVCQTTFLSLLFGLNDVFNCPPMFVGEGFLCVNVEYN